MEKIKTIELDNWVIRMREPAGGNPERIILMLHGWTGDEKAMWVFAKRLPENALLIAPRGMYITPLGGYGWHPYKHKVWPWVDDFIPAIEALDHLLEVKQFSGMGNSKVSIVGFSQGAALAYAFTMLRPYRVSSAAGLSGFLPEGAEALARNMPLQGIQVFVAHGTQDELVPVERARKAVELLERSGAHVIYCEDDVGHKLSANCFNGLEGFFKSTPCD